MIAWKPLLARTLVVACTASAVLSLGVFVGMRLAAADPGGPTRHALTYAGVLRPPAGETLPPSVTLQFSFAKPGAPPCVPPEVTVMLASDGAFTVLVPIDACPAYFDGTDVAYTVTQTSPTRSTLAIGVPVTPVPYARFADQAGVNNDCPAGYVRDVSDPNFIVCRRALGGTPARFDELVNVGFRSSAFWVDRYEASVWDNDTATGT